jgi:hypothetical protein
MRRILATCALALGLANAPALGASLPGRGAVELSPSLAFSYASYFSNSSSNFSVTTLDLDAFVGYSVTDRLELGGSALLSWGSSFGGQTAAGMAGGLTFNFRSGNLAPYLRAEFGFLAYDPQGETNRLFPMLEGGARVMVGNKASVNFTVGFRHQSHPAGSTTLEADTILLGVGVSIFPVRGTE